MKRLILLATLLAGLSPLALHTAQADSARIMLAPGVELHIGDRDPYGRYWDGGGWRDPRDWHDNYRYDEGRWWRYQEWRRREEWRQQEEWRRHEEMRRRHE
ncbi:DUF2502 domain-containing protein [Erwinia papayae]